MIDADPLSDHKGGGGGEWEGRRKGGRGEREAEGKEGCRRGNKIGFCGRCRNRVIHVKCTDLKSNAGKNSGLFFLSKNKEIGCGFIDLAY